MNGSIRSDEGAFDAQLDEVLNLNLPVLKNNRRGVLDAVLVWWKHEKEVRRGAVPRAHFEQERRRRIDGTGHLEPFCQIAVWWLDQRLAKDAGMSEKRHSEAAFETVIEAHLLGHGYLAVPRESFDRERAIFPETLLAFIRETQPTEWAKLHALHAEKTGEQVLADLCKWMDANGSLATLRHGFKC